MNKGIYYHTKNLKMVETAWLDDAGNMLVWTYQDMKTEVGFLATIPLKAFKKHFKYLGEV